MARHWNWREPPLAAKKVKNEEEEGGPSCSRPRARSHSLQGAPEPHKRRRLHAEASDDYGVDLFEVLDYDVPFLLGKGGKTLLRVGKTARCEVEMLSDTHVVEVRGTQEARTRAKRFFKAMLAQRRGCALAKEDFAAGDCTLVMVRCEAVGLLVGAGGLFLRKMEEQYNTLMFFNCDAAKLPGHDHPYETLLILGGRRGRRAAQLAVLSSVETRYPGEYTDATRECGTTYDEEDADGDWESCTTELSNDDIAFALGKKGLTRRKLERSSNCIVQFVHRTVFITGLAADRARAKEYFAWLFAQLDGPVSVDVEGREDVMVLHVPEPAVGYVTGPRRESLIWVESEWGVLMFFNARRTEDRGLTQRLLIFGHARSRVGATLDVMRRAEAVVPGHFTRGMPAKTSEKRTMDTERMLLHEEQLPQLFGKRGDMIKLVSAASGAVLQYVGHVCWVAGELDERRRCLDYVSWICEQSLGRLIIDTRDRPDVSEVHVPAKVAEAVAGRHGEELRRVERASQCLCLFAYDHQGGRRLCIFSHNKGHRFEETGRARAERLVNELIHEKLRELSACGIGDCCGSENDHEYDDESEPSPWNKVDWDS